MRSLTISLSDDLIDYLEQCARREHFGTAEDLVSAMISDSYSGLRAPISDEAFRKLIAEGDDSGSADEADDVYIASFRQRMMKVIDNAAEHATQTKAAG